MLLCYQKKFSYVLFLCAAYNFLNYFRIKARVESFRFKSFSYFAIFVCHSVVQISDLLTSIMNIMNYIMNIMNYISLTTCL